MKLSKPNSIYRSCALVLFSVLVSTSFAQNDLDSIVSKGRILYIMDEVLNVNGYSIPDSFNFEQAVAQIGVPDSVTFGGPEIIEEFGADDYALYYGRSELNAGHGYILYIYVLDGSLTISGVKIGDSRESVKLKLNKNFSDRSTIEFITKGDDILGFIFNAEGKLERMNYWRPL